MERVAIIGTGISSMSAGYFLKDHFDITFFDKENYIGGHTNTLMIDDGGVQIPIDSAFMVFNHETYPNMVKLFAQLGVEEKNTNMSFSVQHLTSGLEYCGTGLNGLFAQRRNVFRPKHYQMLLDIARFNKEAPAVLEDENHLTKTIGEYWQEHGLGQDALEKYLIPMSSAVWSTPPELMKDFPIVTLVRFFKNHGFLGMNTQHQWKTVVNGSQSYRDKIMAHFKGKVQLKTGIQKIARTATDVEISDEHKNKYYFDRVIIGAHANQALNMLEDPTDQEKTLLSKFKYQPNKATLHTDQSLMPKTKGAWSSWNYRIKQKGDRIVPSTIYYMNKLQHVSEREHYFVSINDDNDIDPAKVIWEKMYEHPLFDVDAMQAQKDLPQLNKNGRTYFCGAYFRYGFHEDGLMSGMAVAEEILGRKVL